MAFINPCHRGLAYGDGHIQGKGKLGQVVRVSGDDLFTVNTDPTLRSFGILINDYAAGDMPGIYCNGGVYETDAFDGPIADGEDLKVSTEGRLTGGVAAGDLVIAQTVSIKGGVLKFRLLI